MRSFHPPWFTWSCLASSTVTSIRTYRSLSLSLSSEAQSLVADRQGRPGAALVFFKWKELRICNHLCHSLGIPTPAAQSLSDSNEKTPLLKPRGLHGRFAAPPACAVTAEGFPPRDFNHRRAFQLRAHATRPGKSRQKAILLTLGSSHTAHSPVTPTSEVLGGLLEAH